MAKLSVSDFDHPLVFIVFLVLAIVPVMALARAGLKAAGMPGPASLFGA